MKKIISIALSLILLVGCSGQAGDGEAYIGVSMPTKSSERWITDGKTMKEELESYGYKVDLQYAENVVEDQLSQIENMIAKGVDVLVIAPIDGESLTEVLEQAANQDIEVISYDRLIMNTEHISYYATFDNYKVGVLEAEYIIDYLDLDNVEESFNIELFGGSPDDNNALFFWDGAIDTLQPYFDNGQLVVQSNQTKFNQASTLRWDGATAQTRMDNILNSHYSDKRLDAVLSPIDDISIGVISSLQGVGYGTEDMPYPVITGQDATTAGVKSIINGEQTQTVFKDTRKLGVRTAEIVKSIIEGTDVEVDDTETYDNGVKVVPSILLEPISVDINNYEEILIDSGYYSLEDLK